MPARGTSSRRPLLRGQIAVASRQALQSYRHYYQCLWRGALEVGSALGYAYPQPLDDWVSAYLDAVRKLPRAGGSTHAKDAKT